MDIIGNVYERIDNFKSTATKTELRIIENLKKIPNEELIYQSITELSENIGVAEATILRFCRKLGFKGFQDFKLMLSQDIAGKDEIGDFYGDKIAKEMCDAIMQTRKYIDYELCQTVASKIINANKVCVFSAGYSGIAAMEVKYRLIKAGINVETAIDGHIQTIIAANLTEKDLLILISVSGSTKDIITLAETAKANGTPIVVVTNYFKSPLAKYADYILYNCKKEAPFEGGSLATVVSQSFIVDVICTAVFSALGKQGKIKSIKASNAIIDKLV